MERQTLSASELQTAISKVNKNATVRWFYRSMKDDIQMIAELIWEKGDLAKQMRLVFPILTNSEAVCCSNFQTTNPRCPDCVRNWLAQNYSNQFRTY